MTLPLVSAWLISALAIFGAFLGIPIFAKVELLTAPQLRKLIRSLFIFIIPALLVFGTFYFYYTTYVTDISIRQRLVGILLLYLFLVFDIWTIRLLMVKPYGN